MGILNTQEKSEFRRLCAAIQEVTWTKAELDVASQAVEDWFESKRAEISAAIDAATTPMVLPGPVKVAIVKHYLRQKFQRGG